MVTACGTRGATGGNWLLPADQMGLQIFSMKSMFLVSAFASRAISLVEEGMRKIGGSFACKTGSSCHDGRLRIAKLAVLDIRLPSAPQMWEEDRMA